MVSKIRDSTRLELIYLDSKEHHPDHVILMNWNEDWQLLERPDTKYLRLCRSYGLCPNHSTLVIVSEVMKTVRRFLNIHILNEICNKNDHTRTTSTSSMNFPGTLQS